MNVKYSGKNIEIPVKRVSKFNTGLMFCSLNKSKILLFDFNKNVRLKFTSWFVFFPFIILWLDEKNKVLEKRLIKPWDFSILPSVKNFRKIIEIPLSKKYSRIIKSLDGQKV